MRIFAVLSLVLSCFLVDSASACSNCRSEIRAYRARTRYYVVEPVVVPQIVVAVPAAQYVECEECDECCPVLVTRSRKAYYKSETKVKRDGTVKVKIKSKNMAAPDIVSVGGVYRTTPTVRYYTRQPARVEAVPQTVPQTGDAPPPTGNEPPPLPQ